MGLTYAKYKKAGSELTSQPNKRKDGERRILQLTLISCC